MSASAPQPAQSHAALIWLVRGTGVLIAIPSAYILIETIWALPRMVHGLMSETLVEKISKFCMMLLILLFEVGFLRIGYGMFRKVDAGAVTIFAFIFSFLTAVAFHHFLLRAPFLGHHSVWWPWSYRATLSLIAFLALQRVTKAYLLRVLEPNLSNPPQNPPPIDPETPEFPGKSPLVQL
jgi:hypothetical protein